MTPAQIAEAQEPSWPADVRFLPKANPKKSHKIKIQYA
jgi:hypothetical protein